MKSTMQEFKEFIMKGNIIDMAVGVIMGGAFGKIVTSLVDNILMPLIGVLSGGVNVEELMIKVGNAEVLYGVFLQNVIDFLIIAVCMFVFVKAMAKLKFGGKKEEPAPEPEPEISDEVRLLGEIKELLAEQNKAKEQK
ncbi:large-conductance mechanosensitive channel protein MscL [uncultured Faecalibaculum sp.]|uniref:large-conductance mechanosensitive channel protein MscL n=1 Tax=uncultured Faecalibaculum sp. TaxID=1729681 RepID=UPI003437A112